MKPLTPKQVSKAVYDDYYKKFAKDPTHFNASMKFLTWGDYMEEFEPDHKPEHLKAIREAEDRYNALVDAGRDDEYWRICSECKQRFSGKIKAMICEKCKE